MCWFFGLCMLSIISRQINGASFPAPTEEKVESKFPHPSTTNLTTLIVAQMFFKYGLRSPIYPYVTDPHKDFDYGVLGRALGQITPQGVNEMVKLGEYVRLRYGDFIGCDYNPDELFAQSSDFERCLVSTSSFLEAFYISYPCCASNGNHHHNHGDESFDKSFGIENGSHVEKNVAQKNPKPLPSPCHSNTSKAIPYHAISPSVDNFLAATASCPAFDNLYSKFQKSEFVKEFNEEIDDFAAAAARSGQSYQDIKYMVMTDLWDTLKIQKAYNLTIPHWAEKVYHSAQLSAQLQRISEVYTPELRRLKAGPLITTIVQNFLVNSWTDRTEASSLLTPAEIDAYRTAKLYVYGAHDTTLAHALYTLEIFNGLVPDYGAAVFFELHYVHGKRIVEIYYKSGSESSILQLKIPGCGPPCLLQDFQAKVSAFLIDSKTWKEECNIHKPEIGDEHHEGHEHGKGQD